MHELLNILHTAAAFSVSFSQTVYSTDEDNGLVQLELVLSDSSSTSTTIQVVSMEGSATGNYISIYSIIIMYMHKCIFE